MKTQNLMIAIYLLEIFIAVSRVGCTEKELLVGLMNVYQTNPEKLRYQNIGEVNRGITTELESFVRISETFRKKDQISEQDVISIKKSAITIMSCINTGLQIHLHKLNEQIISMLNSLQVSDASLYRLIRPGLELFFTDFIVNLRFDPEYELNVSTTKLHRGKETHRLNKDKAIIFEIKSRLSKYKSRTLKEIINCISLSLRDRVAFEVVLERFYKFLSVLLNFEDQMSSNHYMTMNLHSSVLEYIIPSREFFDNSSDTSTDCYQYTCLLLDYIMIEQHMLYFLQNYNNSQSQIHQNHVTDHVAEENSKSGQTANRTQINNGVTSYPKSSVLRVMNPHNFLNHIKSKLVSTKNARSSKKHVKESENKENGHQYPPRPVSEETLSLIGCEEGAIQVFVEKSKTLPAASLPGPSKSTQDAHVAQNTPSIRIPHIHLFNEDVLPLCAANNLTRTIIQELFQLVYKDMCAIAKDSVGQQSFDHEQLDNLKRKFHAEHQLLKNGNFYYSLFSNPSLLGSSQLPLLPLSQILQETISIAQGLICILKGAPYLKEANNYASNNSSFINELNSNRKIFFLNRQTITSKDVISFFNTVFLSYMSLSENNGPVFLTKKPSERQLCTKTDFAVNSIAKTRTKNSH